jgi:membrane protease YdiL (CAAX protease family)
MSKFSIPQEWRNIFWVGLAIYILSNLYLVSIGESFGTLALFLGRTLYYALLIWLTIKVTNQISPEEKEANENKSKLWIQIVVIGLVIIITGFSLNLPLWSNVVEWSYNFGEATLPAEWFGGPGNSVANPVQYFVIPFILLLLLGAKPAELGFGKGHKVWRALLVWLALPIVAWIIFVASGMMPLQSLLRRIIGNTFQNGFFEEFLFRGALQTRLGKLVSVPWALTLQAIIFGLWHLRANTQMMDGNILAALVVCLISQTVSGFVFGYIFHRTKNLLVPTVAHVAMNTLG